MSSGLDPNVAASRNSLRQAVTTSTGATLHGDFVAMVERLQAENSPGLPAVTAVQASRRAADLDATPAAWLASMTSFCATPSATSMMSFGK